METVEVKKRDGTGEPWSYDKVVTSISRAGLPIESAEDIASQVQDWAMKAASGGTIDSTQIREKVYSLMTDVDPASAENYKVYKKD